MLVYELCFSKVKIPFTFSEILLRKKPHKVYAAIILLDEYENSFI